MRFVREIQFIQDEISSFDYCYIGIPLAESIFYFCAAMIIMSVFNLNFDILLSICGKI